MTFTEVQTEYHARWEKSEVGGYAFCDWCEEQGVSPEHVGTWRQWIRMGGVGGLVGQLRRLANAEASRAPKS